MATNLLIKLIIEEIFGTFNSRLYSANLCAWSASNSWWARDASKKKSHQPAKKLIYCREVIRKQGVELFLIHELKFLKFATRAFHEPNFELDSDVELRPDSNVGLLPCPTQFNWVRHGRSATSESPVEFLPDRNAAPIQTAIQQKYYMPLIVDSSRSVRHTITITQRKYNMWLINRWNNCLVARWLVVAATLMTYRRWDD